MSKIWVDRIEAMAKRRIARTAQVAALPPQPERLNQNLWHLNRRPWVHERIPGLMSRDVGAISPVKAALSDPRIAAALLVQFPDIDLEQLMVSPELPIEIYNAINLNVASYDPTAPTEAIMSLYKPAGYQESSDVSIRESFVGPIPLNDRRFYNGRPLMAPCIIREISYQMPTVATGAEITLSVDGYGIVAQTTGNWNETSSAIGRTGRGLDRWVLTGAVVPRIELFANGGIITDFVNLGNLVVITEPLVRV